MEERVGNGRKKGREIVSEREENKKGRGKNENEELGEKIKKGKEKGRKIT